MLGPAAAWQQRRTRSRATRLPYVIELLSFWIEALAIRM